MPKQAQLSHPKNTQTMKPKHYQFCLNYLRTHDPGVAYKMTYPKASIKSVYAAASRLMAREDVAAWIRETEERMHERALREVEEQTTTKLKEQLMTINEKRTILTKIITGETKRKRHIKTKYGTREIEDDLPVYAVLRAIDMDTRLENFYNLLTNPHTWQRAQAVYVNTPTLQQQVNVLIAQNTPTPTTSQQDDTPTQQETVILPPQKKATNHTAAQKLTKPPFKKTPHYLTKLNKNNPQPIQLSAQPCKR